LQRGLRGITARETSIDIVANGPTILEDILDRFALKIDYKGEVILKFKAIKNLVESIRHEEGGSIGTLRLPKSLPVGKVIEVTVGLMGQTASLQKAVFVGQDSHIAPGINSQVR